MSDPVAEKVILTLASVKRIPVDTITLKVVTKAGPATEAAVLKTKATLPNEEALEIKAI